MLERLGHFVYRRRRVVLYVTAAALAAAGVFGGNVANYLKAGGFDNPDIESEQATAVLRDKFKQAPPNFLLLVTSNQGTVDQGAAKAAGIKVTNELLGEEGVGQVVSHWSLGPASALASEDRTKAIVIAEIEGEDDAARGEIVERLLPKYNVDFAGASVRVGGFEAVFDEVGKTIESDLAKAESAALPITLVLLIVIFGSLAAASLPLGIGILSVLGTFLVLRVLSSITDVSVFALSMVTAMGLGLAIDYSLFIVSRFREELRKGKDTEAAIVSTMVTAGRTIIFGGITVAVSLIALLVFPVYFFKSFGYAGIAVVLTAVFGAVITLPALLSVMGPRVDWSPGFFPFKQLSAWQLRHHKEVGEGFWHRLAVLVMRRPVSIGAAVVVLLLLLGAPFLHVNLGLPDERVLPPGAETRKVHDTLRNEFSSNEINSVRVVANNVDNPIVQKPKIAIYAASLSKLAGVDHVDSLAGRYEGGVRVKNPGPAEARFASANETWFQVIPSVDPLSKDGEALAKHIRDGSAPFDILVGGTSAQLVDTKDILFSSLPWAISIIGLATFVLLFLMFGSLLVPAKALVLNVLSLTATFGAMVWIFQDGHLSGVLDFTPTGTLDISAPILMFCIAFGLSMDYEVFLLSRIKEEYDRTGENEHSVAVGLERTGRIVTAAAVLISVVFLSFATSSVRFIKLFGIGMALAVLMDAFVIRGTLVPAFMRLAGRANWWLPAFLRPLQKRLEIREVHDVVDVAPVAPPLRSGEADAPVERSRKASAKKKAPAKRTNGRAPSKAKKPAKRKSAPKRKATR